MQCCFLLDGTYVSRLFIFHLSSYFVVCILSPLLSRTVTLQYCLKVTFQSPSASTREAVEYLETYQVKTACT
jgi:hypothetical protein